MKTVLTFLLFMITALTWNQSFAQDKQLVDSLETQLKKLKATKLELGKNGLQMSDTLIADILVKLSQEYWGNNPDKALENAEKSLSISKELSYKKGIAKAYYSIGIIHSDWGEFPEAIELQEKALKLCQEINNMPGIADSYNEIGLCYYYTGNNPEALKNYFASIKINEQLGNKKAAAGTYMNIGNVYKNTMKYDEALKNHQLSLEAFKEIGFKRGIAMAYNNIGAVNLVHGKYFEALRSFQSSLEIKQELGDKRGIANAYNNIATVNDKQGNYVDAINNYNSSIQLQEEIGDKNGQTASYVGMSETLQKMGNLKEALDMVNRGLALALETGNKNALNESYLLISTLNERLKNYKAAYENHILYKQAYDSVFNAENDMKLTQLQMQFGFDKKAQADSLKFVQEKEIAAIKLQKQKAYTYGGILGIAITVILLFFVYHNYSKQRTANQKLKEAQEQLIKSEKMAAFGVMATRVSHEILNPLNFVNNFSELSQEVVKDVIQSTTDAEKKENADILISNLQKINEHGKRAEVIVKQLQELSRKGTAHEFFEEKN